MTLNPFRSFKIIGALAVIFIQHTHAQITLSTAYPIIYSSQDAEHRDLYITTLDGSDKKRLTNFAGGNGYSAWSPDGKRIAFYAKYDDRKTWSIHTVNAEGTNRQRLTQMKDYWDNSPTWSPDGATIAFARAFTDEEGNRQFQIWQMNADGTQQQQIQSLSGGGPYFGPNGQIVYHSQPGPSEIFIANAD